MLVKAVIKYGNETRIWGDRDKIIIIIIRRRRTAKLRTLDPYLNILDMVK
jgi:hypothetical protein